MAVEEDVKIFDGGRQRLLDARIRDLLRLFGGRPVSTARASQRKILTVHRESAFAKKLWIAGRTRLEEGTSTATTTFAHRTD